MKQPKLVVLVIAAILLIAVLLIGEGLKSRMAENDARAEIEASTETKAAVLTPIMEGVDKATIGDELTLDDL